MKIVPNWRQHWRSMSVWAMSLGIVLPDLLNIVAENVAGFPWMDDGWKSIVRTICLCLALVLHFVNQPKMHPDKPEQQ